MRLNSKYHLFITAILIFLFFTKSTLSQSKSTSVNTAEVSKIDKLMQYSYENGMFNGVILVTNSGEPIYKKAFGYADKINNRKLNDSSIFYLASVSKQFTAMAIMILKEQGKLSFEDKLTMYFPEFSGFANDVTIKQLMTHTSGMPDQYRLGIYKAGLTNEMVKEALLKHGKLNFKPGYKYSYSNGGYVLLSLIVEKVSGISFHEFMELNIFNPLGMANTLVYDESAPNIENRAVGYDHEGELNDYNIFTTGAGGMYSNVHDLYLWDQALYTEILVSKTSLEEAFTSTYLNNGTLSNYGYGWIVSDNNGQKVV